MKQFRPAKVIPSYFLFLLFLAVITGLISEGEEFSTCSVFYDINDISNTIPIFEL